jgi:uncharacterized repeat protein (TIGR02543 family)
MKGLYKVLNIFAIAAVIALLGGCFSPWAGDGATITIHVGGGSGRTTAFHLLDDDAKARISYMLDLSGPSNMTDVPFAPGTQTINLSVAPGIYTITVTAYLDGEVYATGSATAEARAGQSTPVDILMRYAGETTEKTFTVTFDSNGGSPVDQQTVPNGGMAAPPAKPTKSGEGFVRWCSDITLDTEYDFDTPVTSDITLYAQWSRIIYTVTFNSNDGSPIEDELVGEGGKVTPPEENPTRSGFVFGGWYSDPSLTTLYIFANQIYSNTTIYAKWIPQFTVTFNTNGGSPVPPSQTITQGGKVTPPSNNPTQDGFVFDGWYSNDDLTEMYDFDNNEIYSDAAIYAKWIQQFNVTFDTNGGSPVPAQQTVTQGGKVTRPSNNPTQIGFVFDGWYSNDDFTTEYDFDTEIYSDTAIYAKWNESIIEMVSIPAGTFTMGSPTTEADRGGDETQHSVTLTGFYMGKYQVTQEQYQAVIGSNPSNFKIAVDGESGTPGKLPVEMVSWYDAIVFCNELSMMEGLDPVYSISGKTDPAEWGETVPTSSDATWNAAVMDKSKNGYRLPTEAEWEYACRAGTTTAYNTGATISDDTGWYSVNSGNKTHQVGLKPANTWGLYDMHGNLFEWCWDWNGYYPNGAQTDPTGAVSGSNRVHRNSSFIFDEKEMRSARRRSDPPSFRYFGLGLRLVRSLP